jgi:tetratricopeptide (TPR) repeat protein
VYYERGLERAKKQEYDKAIADYDQAIELDPTNPEVYYARGYALRLQREYDKAIADYGRAITLSPADAAPYTGRSIAWVEKQEYAKALADCNKAIELDPTSAMVYTNRGVVWRKQQEYGKALADYDKAIALDPGYAGAYNCQGWLRATCPDDKYRDGKKAVEFATRACELSSWKDAYTVGTLAAACAEAGDFPTAVKWQEKANKMYNDPGDRAKGEKRLTLFRDGEPFREE